MTAPTDQHFHPDTHFATNFLLEHLRAHPASDTEVRLARSIVALFARSGLLVEGVTFEEREQLTLVLHHGELVGCVSPVVPNPDATFSAPAPGPNRAARRHSKQKGTP